MINFLEQLSLNAWPAFHTLLLDGWVVRFAAGYTRRANSVNPLFPSQTPFPEKVAWCEELYRARGLPVIFKMTPACQPAELDGFLETRGYALEAPTSVQTLDLRSFSGDSPAGLLLGPHPGEDWLAAFARMSALQPRSEAVHRRILAAIQPSACYAAFQVEGQIVAGGLGVLENGFIGLYDILVDPDFRRRGLGEAVCRGLLSWAHQKGARASYLQVMLNNPPALSLYARLGYRESYRYWYRVKK